MSKKSHSPHTMMPGKRQPDYLPRTPSQKRVEAPKGLSPFKEPKR